MQPPPTQRARTASPLTCGRGRCAQALEPGERVLLVCCTTDPAACAKKDQSPFVKFFDHAIHVPAPIYGARAHSSSTPSALRSALPRFTSLRARWSEQPPTRAHCVRS